MSYESMNEILDDHDHKGQPVRDALKHVINTYMKKYSLDHAGHLIAVVDEEWHVLAKHVNAGEHALAVSHAGSKFRGKTGVAWVGVLSIDLIAYLLDAHQGVKA